MEEAKEEIECPTCGAKIPADSTECPECGEPIGEVPLEEEVAPKPGKGLLYGGIILFILGILIALASVVDEYVGIISKSSAFGPLNVAVVVVGVIVLVIGIIMTGMGMKKPKEEKEEEAPVEEELEEIE